MTATPYGFRIVGAVSEPRKLVDATSAFTGYAACDELAEVNREAYLSAFQFGADFEKRDNVWRVDVRGFNGPCWAPWLWYDIDRDGDLEGATRDARRLAAGIAERFGLDGDELLCFFSGSKGYHVGLPTSLWRPAAAVDFHRIARRFAEDLAGRLSLGIDTGVYDEVRAFRAPNSRHAKTGLHKRRLMSNELLGMKIEAIVKLAREPEPFDLPEPPAENPQAVADWRGAAQAVQSQTEANRERRAAKTGATLNRQTLDFIRDGATERDRHRLLFSAAANLAEFGCPADLARALLTEAGLDCGLPHREVERQIRCGLEHNGAAA